MNIRNQNDIATDARALGPSQMGIGLKTVTTYNEPGLPPPPAGWNRKLPLTALKAPDTCCD